MMDLWRLAQVRQRELLEEAERARLARKVAQRRRRKSRALGLIPLVVRR
ncbi:hypothetical protein J7J35_04925 [Candidatus Bipolaricaulota bacterium]|nr:hypothetical protein [Candidatus Bipolaricaulota bacterium]